MSDEKIVIYQVLPRLFSNMCDTCVPNGTYVQNGAGKLNHFTSKVLREIKKLGANYIWYTGVIEHATKTDYSKYGIRKDNKYVVKGEAGSPYAIKDYYDIDPDLAEDPSTRMQEFEALVTRTHEVGLKVVLDFVPNHVARQYHSDTAPEGVDDLGAHDNKEMHFSPSNNFYYIPRQAFTPQFYIGEGEDRYFEYPAKATGNDCFGAFPGEYDWYETVKLNYGVDYTGGGRCHFDPIPDTWYKMLDILLFWCGKGVDAFRCDMAHMVPVEFWNWAISKVKENYPSVIFIAEIYDQALYRVYIEKGKFDYLYDKVGLYDKLRGVLCHQVSAAQLTYCWQSVDGIGGKMLNFLENHDEQRFASDQFAGDADKVLPALVVSSMMNTGPMMIYFGQELGERAEDAEQAQAQIAARLGDAVDSVQPQQEAVHPLRAGPDDGDGADGDERDGLHIVESVEQVFKQGHERRRGHLCEKAEHVRLLQAGALQDREQDAHERKQAQQQKERGIARIERDAQRGDALRPFFDPAVKTHAKPSFLPTA